MPFTFLNEIEDAVQLNSAYTAYFKDGTSKDYIFAVEKPEMRNGHVIGPYGVFCFEVTESKKQVVDGEHMIYRYCQPVPWTTPAGTHFKNGVECEVPFKTLKDLFEASHAYLGNIEYIEIKPLPNAIWYSAERDPAYQFRGEPEPER